MDKRRSILNVSVSITSRILLLFVALFVRRILIQQIGNEANGLNSLFASIIGTLSVVELGIGRAIVYSMYSPIIADDKHQIAALYCLYRKLYRIIGVLVFAGGLAVMPFLPRLISDYEELNINVYLTFFLTLISVVLTYLYSAKSSLIEAYKDNFVTTIIMTVARLIKYGLQIGAIITWHSFPMFLVCQIIETLLIWGLTAAITQKKHRDIISIHASLEKEKKEEIVRNVKAMVMHKIGNIMVAGVDSIIISGFIGVNVLGKYNNYTYISGMMAGILALFFSPLTSVVGHFCALGDPNQTQKWFDHFFFLNYVLGMVFFLGYYAVIDSLVSLLFGVGLSISRPIVFVISLNQFTVFMRNATLLFRNASGTFYYDRWKPLFEGAVNLLLSLAFVVLFPTGMRIVGVIVATIITTLLICDTVEPFVVYRHVFKKSPSLFYVKNYTYIGVFVFCLIVVSTLIQKVSNPVTGVLVNGTISIMVSFAAFVLLTLFDKSFRREARTMREKALKVVSS